jgi:hypothetical protein
VPGVPGNVPGVPGNVLALLHERAQQPNVLAGGVLAVVLALLYGRAQPALLGVLNAQQESVLRDFAKIWRDGFDGCVPGRCFPQSVAEGSPFRNSSTSSPGAFVDYKLGGLATKSFVEESRFVDSAPI